MVRCSSVVGCVVLVVPVVESVEVQLWWCCCSWCRRCCCCCSCCRCCCIFGCGISGVVYGVGGGETSVLLLMLLWQQRRYFCCCRCCCCHIFGCSSFGGDGSVGGGDVDAGHIVVVGDVDVVSYCWLQCQRLCLRQHLDGRLGSIVGWYWWKSCSHMLLYLLLSLLISLLLPVVPSGSFKHQKILESKCCRANHNQQKRKTKTKTKTRKFSFLFFVFVDWQLQVRHVADRKLRKLV